MPTTRYMTTVLPYSVDPAAPFHLSLFFSHRLEGGGTLSSYPVMVNWVKTLTNPTTTVELRTGNGATVPCRPQLGIASRTDWATTFPPTTVVRDYPESSVTGPEWVSFPAHRMPDYALAAHLASALCSPIDRPGVIGNPIAEAVFEALGGVDGAVQVVRDLKNYWEGKESHRQDLIEARNAAANAALDPQKPVPENPFPINPPSLADRIAATPWRSPIELLLAQDTLDADISRHLATVPEVAPGGVPVDPTLGMLRDLQRANRYYERPEAQYPPQPFPDSPVGPPRTERQAPDFHERAASVGNVPALLRKLGLVVDVKVDPDHLATLRATDRIWCDVTIAAADTEKYLSPETVCDVDGFNFFAVPGDSSRWHIGRMRVGNDLRYRVLDLDPDAAGLALEQHLRSAFRALAIAVNGDRGSFAPAGLRATGFAIAELNRSDRLHDDVEAGEGREPVIEDSGSPQARPVFGFEHLLRGTRVEVRDDVTKRWHSLHERRVTASFRESPAKQHPILNDERDSGMLQHPPLSRTPDDDDNPYYAHEVLAGWDGWSLSAPRPGLQVIHNATDHEDPEAERLDAEGEQTDGLHVQSKVEPGSLPALRYGRQYSFRIAGVDLAGNHVPMAQTSSADVSESGIDAATTHLDKLRTAAAERDARGVLAAIRDSGGLPSPAGGGSGVRADVHRATASVIANASTLSPHRSLDVEPALLAELAADVADPATVTEPRAYLRWDPIPAPTLVPRSAYTVGESLKRMVVRTGIFDTPGMCQRHIVPPKGSELEAEQDGRLDHLMGAGRNPARAYAIALKERGSLFHTAVQDLDNPRGTLPQPGVQLLATPGATGLKTLAEIQHPDVQPAEGQYIVHDVDQMTLPYLPDPMAHGVALIFYEAGADHEFSDPKVLQSVFLPYQGSWPQLQPLRIVLQKSTRLDAMVRGNLIEVGLPPGEQVAVKYSTTLDDQHLAKMGVWAHHPVHDPNVPAEDKKVLADAACNGWMWWLTPDEDLRLVHATARPAVRPRIDRLVGKHRRLGVVPLSLDGVLDVHGPSTEKVELRAEWTDCVDDPSVDRPTEQTTTEVVADYRIGERERHSLLTLDPPGAKPADRVGSRRVAEPIRTALHNLPDTRARNVRYRLYGTSRYREFFEPNALPDVNDPESAGNVVEVNVPSSSPPPPPRVHDVIPMFKWEQTTEPEHPLAVRRVRRSGVRIWLDRPWNASGCGEMLAVIATGDPNLPGVRPETVSVWARDPMLMGPAMEWSYEVPVLSALQQRAVQLRLTPESLPGRPALHVVRQGPTDQTERDKFVSAYGYHPEFDDKRKRWFVDVILDSTKAVWPFLRLAVARYQPNSVANADFSEIVATDFVQLPPERIGTLSRPAGDHVRISLSGVTAVTNAPNISLPGDLVDLLPRSRHVVATLQARNLLSDSDIDWVKRAEVQCELAGVDVNSFDATWTAALPLNPAEPLETPGASDDLRVQVEEYEILTADPDPGESTVTATRRLVYADHFYL